MHPFQKSTLIGYSFFSERGVIDMLRLSMSEINQAKFRNAIRKALEIQIFSLNFVPFVVSDRGMWTTHSYDYMFDFDGDVDIGRCIYYLW